MTDGGALDVLGGGQCMFVEANRKSCERGLRLPIATVASRDSQSGPRVCVVLSSVDGMKERGKREAQWGISVAEKKVRCV